MADHVDANPTKGAGKLPRVPRTRKASLSRKHTSASGVGVVSKRKSRYVFCNYGCFIRGNM